MGRIRAVHFISSDALYWLRVHLHAVLVRSAEKNSCNEAALVLCRLHGWYKICLTSWEHVPLGGVEQSQQ